MSTNNLIGAECTVLEIEHAQKLRHRRDVALSPTGKAEDAPNYFEVKDTDLRWCGELAEQKFTYHLAMLGIDYEWIIDNPVNNADVHIPLKGKKPLRIDVKCSKMDEPYCGVPPQQRWGGLFPVASLKKEKLNHIFFTVYDVVDRIIWFMGGIGYDRFMAESKLCPKGVPIDNRLVPREDMRDLPYSELIAPGRWFEALKRRAT